jgi:hypothetical protein
MSFLPHLSIYFRPDWYGSTASLSLPHAMSDSAQYENIYTSVSYQNACHAVS